MKRMTKEERKEIESYITKIMADATGWEYARYILEHESEDEFTFMDDVIADVITSSAWEDDGDYSDDDIRLAIGRVFMSRMEIFY